MKQWKEKKPKNKNNIVSKLKLSDPTFYLNRYCWRSVINLVPHSCIALHGQSSSKQISLMDDGFSVGLLCNSQSKHRPCAGFLSDVCSRLCCLLGRRPKGAAHSKNGEEEHLLTAWRPGERAGNKEGILEAASAVSRNHCKNDSHISACLLD